MKRINSKTLATIIVIIVVQAGFILSQYLATWIAGSVVALTTNVVLILNISKILSLIGGIVWVIWLLKNKYNASYTWRDTFPLIVALLLIEYWYFVERLLSLTSSERQ